MLENPCYIYVHRSRLRLCVRLRSTAWQFAEPQGVVMLDRGVASDPGRAERKGRLGNQENFADGSDCV